MANFDDMKLAVEALSGGKNTVLFDDMGMPSIVFPFAKQMPAVLKFLFTEKDIDNMIETVLAEAKEKWGTNENLQEIVAMGDIARKFVLCTEATSEADTITLEE